MKASVISEMTTDELADHLIEAEESYRKLTMQHAVSPLENPLLIRSKRKDIARLNTEMNKRRAAEQAEK